MKYKLLLPLLLLIFSSTIANPVQEDIARKAALNFLHRYSKLKSGFIGISGAYTSSFNNTATFYAFTISNGGWILISADDAATPVLAYSSIGEWNESTLNATAKKWIEGYSRQIYEAIQSGQINETSQSEWQSLLGQRFSDAITTVPPLLTTQWDQNRYYNDLCPASSQAPPGYNGKVPTGCVATTMAQIMKYYKYPAQGIGSFSYNHPAYNTLTANFGSTDYNWNSMPDKATSTNTSLATLMYHCGVAVQMNYDPTGSGAMSEVVPYALKTYFNYDNSIQILNRSVVGNDEIWRTILRTELEAGRPVYYAGSGTAGGHAFVCDGYDASNPTKFHINWGWSGSSNGYFAMGALTTSNGAFNDFNQIITGIKPRTSPDYICRIESPADGAKINQGTNIPVTVKTIKGTTSKVILYIDGVKKDSSSAAPFNFNLTTSKLSPGIHTLSVKATDGTTSDHHESEFNILSPCWQLQNFTFTTDSVTIEQISAVDENVVWAKVDDYSSKDLLSRKYIKTTDGGTTWTEGSVNCTNCSTMEISNIFAFSATRAFACLNPGNSTGGAIMYTEDGGATWVQQTSANFANSWANWVYFFDENNGVCMGDSYKPLFGTSYSFAVYTTSNGGTTWTRVNSPELPLALNGEAGTENFYAAFGNTIWFGTGNGRIYKSANKGLTWTVKDAGLGTVQTNVRFKDANDGYAFGGFGSGLVFKKTTDGGTNWTDAKPQGIITGMDYEFVPGTDSVWINSGVYSSISLNNNKSYYLLDQNTLINTTKFLSPVKGWGGGFYSVKGGGGIYKWSGSFTPAISSKITLKITDKNGNPIPEATTTFNYQTKTTNEKGLSTFGITSFGNPETYTVTKAGYTPAMANYIIEQDDTVRITLMPSYSVTFTVRNKMDALLSGASVIFNGQIQQTNTNGTATFSNVSKGTGYPFAVTKVNYYAGYGKADVKDANPNIEVVLTADVTGVKLAEKKNHAVFPNPASDILNIVSDENITGIEIITLEGKTALRKSFLSNTIQLNLSDLKEGEYILKVIQGKTEEISKIIIKR